MNILNTQTLSNEALQSKLWSSDGKARTDRSRWFGAFYRRRRIIQSPADGHHRKSQWLLNRQMPVAPIASVTVMSLKAVRWWICSLKIYPYPHHLWWAAKRLGASVISIDIAKSSTQKGESLRDTLWNLEAMTAGYLWWCVIHRVGLRTLWQTEVTPNIAIINGGDGWHAHPTQADARYAHDLSWSAKTVWRINGSDYRWYQA